MPAEEAEAQVRKQEEGLLLENHVWMSTTLLAVRLADKMGDQDKTLEILTCHLQRQKCSTQRLGDELSKNLRPRHYHKVFGSHMSR